MSREASLDVSVGFIVVFRCRNFLGLCPARETSVGFSHMRYGAIAGVGSWVEADREAEEEKDEGKEMGLSVGFGVRGRFGGSARGPGSGLCSL